MCCIPDPGSTGLRGSSWLVRFAFLFIRVGALRLPYDIYRSVYRDGLLGCLGEGRSQLEGPTLWVEWEYPPSAPPSTGIYGRGIGVQAVPLRQN